MRRRAVILSVLALIAVVSAPALRPAFERARLLYGLAIDPPPTQLRNPVDGASSRAVVNTWAAPRPGGRLHEGVDIFAPRDTPIVSTTRGLVTKVGTNSLGGQVVWILGPGLESHYYAHLDRFADIHRGDIVHAGDLIGYVGRTGNARGTPFHLHYGIYRRGKAENPYPRLISGSSSSARR
jgi:murein DD-endopeptidase MepM/ murein hydrolase activator NlpD